MVKKILVLLLAAGLLCTPLWIISLHADEGEEVIQKHSLDVYSGAARMYSTDRNQLLSKDPLAKVQKFYEANKKSGDRIEPYKTEEEQGFRLTYYRTIKGKEQSVLELQCTERKPNSDLHPALGELKAQAMMGKHPEAEYNMLEVQYKNLNMAYYRFVDDGQGRTTSEGEQIYRKAYKQAHDRNKPQVSASEQSQGQAKSQVLKNQMQALKVKGDYAGMMKLAQQSPQSPRQTTAGAAAMDAMSHDTWELWVTCLKDLKAAAFWSKLQYSDGVLPSQK